MVNLFFAYLYIMKALQVSIRPEVRRRTGTPRRMSPAGLASIRLFVRLFKVPVPEAGIIAHAHLIRSRSTLR